jgi:outer membrane biosynthesis protein TonB
MKWTRRRRYTAAFLAAAGVQLILLGSIGLYGLWKEEQKEPEVIDVTIADSRGNPAPGGKSSGGKGSFWNKISEAVQEETQELMQKEEKTETKEAPSPDNTPSDAASGSENQPAAGSGDTSAGTAGSSSGEGGGDGGNASGESSGSGSGMPGSFESDGNGVYTATSPDGLDYTILQDANASYPAEARDIGYAEEVAVTGDILVGLDGSVIGVTILNDVPDLGFREEAERAFWQMRFAPIYYNGVNIQMHFQKTIHFIP